MGPTTAYAPAPLPVIPSYAPAPAPTTGYNYPVPSNPLVLPERKPSPPNEEERSGFRPGKLDNSGFRPLGGSGIGSDSEGRDPKQFFDDGGELRPSELQFGFRPIQDSDGTSRRPNSG